MNFCYTTASVEQLAEYFLTCTTQAISQQLCYYKGRENTNMVFKIQAARILSKQMALQKKLDILNAI